MPEITLKRKLYTDLLKWKNEYAPEYALFIKGARRVGKTTIAEEFGRNEYKSFVTINFQSANDTIRELFVNSLLDLDYFYNVIQMQYGKKLYARESLIILDEIQLYPLARQALKTLLGDGRYDFIETGSLISIRENVRDIVIPEGEENKPHDIDRESFFSVDRLIAGLSEHPASLAHSVIPSDCVSRYNWMPRSSNSA